MVDIGADPGLLMVAQNVSLEVSPTASSTATETPDTLYTMRSLVLDDVTPESVTYHGKDRVYFHGPPDILLDFSMSVSSDLVDYLAERRGGNNRNTLPTHPFVVQFTDEKGDTRRMLIHGQLTRNRWVRNEQAPQQLVEVHCTLRILETEFKPLVIPVESGG